MTYYPRKSTKKKKRRILITLALLSSVLIGGISGGISPVSLFNRIVENTPLSYGFGSLSSGRGGLSDLIDAEVSISTLRPERQPGGPSASTSILTEEGVRAVHIISPAAGSAEESPYVSYYDFTGGEFVVARCHGIFCMPMFREQ